MEDRTAIKQQSSFDKINRICELETAKPFFRQLQATLAEKREVNVAPSGTSVRRRRNRQRRPINVRLLSEVPGVKESRCEETHIAGHFR